jgi:hypothetical protein
VRRIIIFVGLTLAAALPVAAHTFGLVPSSPSQACLAVGGMTYRFTEGDADVTVRIDPVASTPGLRINLTETAEDADFVLVDDGAMPNCRTATNVKKVGIAGGAGYDLIVSLPGEASPADYRIYVRSRWITPETAAALFAAAHMPARRMAGGAPHRPN